LEELKKLSQNGFHECFLASRSVFTEQGEYYEGNAALVIVLFVFTRNEVILGTL
jgi:hypothetical protein